MPIPPGQKAVRFLLCIMYCYCLQVYRSDEGERGSFVEPCRWVTAWQVPIGMMASGELQLADVVKRRARKVARRNQSGIGEASAQRVRVKLPPFISNPRRSIRLDTETERSRRSSHHPSAAPTHRHRIHPDTSLVPGATAVARVDLSECADHDSPTQSSRKTTTTTYLLFASVRLFAPAHVA